MMSAAVLSARIQLPIRLKCGDSGADWMIL